MIKIYLNFENNTINKEKSLDSNKLRNNNKSKNKRNNDNIYKDVSYNYLLTLLNNAKIVKL